MIKFYNEQNDPSIHGVALKDLFSKAVEVCPHAKDAKTMLHYMHGYLAAPCPEVNVALFIERFLEAVEAGIIEWRE